MTLSCVAFCGVHKLTRFQEVPEGILRENHFLRSATTKSFLNNLRNCLGEHRIWSSHWTLWNILFDINKRRWGSFRIGGSKWRAESSESWCERGNLSPGAFLESFAVFLSASQRHHQIEISFRTKDRVGVTFRCEGCRVDTKRLEICNQSVTFWLNAALPRFQHIALWQRSTKSCHSSFLHSSTGELTTFMLEETSCELVWLEPNKNRVLIRFPDASLFGWVSIRLANQVAKPRIWISSLIRRISAPSASLTHKI